MLQGLEHGPLGVNKPLLPAKSALTPHVFLKVERYVGIGQKLCGL